MTNFTPSTPPTRLQKKPPVKAAPEEKGSLWGRIALWLFIVAGIGGIVAMVVMNPRQKPLICRNVMHSGSSSLTGMGTCTTE